MPAKVKKRSELWQRIRAAREYAKLTQLQLAERLGVSRALVALWESRDPNNRSRPNADAMMSVARECGVPVAWLFDDSYARDSIEAFLRGSTHPAAKTPRQDKEPSAATEFWRTVRSRINLDHEELAICFDVEVPVLESTMLVGDFVRGHRLIEFVANDEPETLLHAVGRLLMLERGIGQTMDKQTWVYRRTGEPCASAPSAKRQFDIAVRVFANTQSAVDELVAP